mgnify:CR=1 FL=1
MNRTALVTGATGFLGAFFVALLLRKGVRVNALIRNASERSLLPTINNIGSLQADIPKDLRAGFSSFEGNVRDTDCGLSDTDLDRIIPETTDIWHFAAAFEERSNERGDVYATNVGGTSEIVDSHVGLLVDKNFSFDDISNAINKLIGNRKQYSKMAFRKWRDVCDKEKNFLEFYSQLKEY